MHLWNGNSSTRKTKTTTNNQQQMKLSIKFVRGQKSFLLNKPTELEREE
jgi:hypothetical protein